MTGAKHCTDEVAQLVVGSHEAQQLIESLADETLSTEHAWLGFVQVAARFGWRSAACRAYIVELAKRAARPGAQ